MPRTRRLLGDQGTTFARNFVSYPLCCPSRATLLTGQYAHNSGVLGNRPPQGGYQKLRPTADRTLPVWLSRAGYDTVHIGKYLNGYGAADAGDGGAARVDGVARLRRSLHLPDVGLPPERGRRRAPVRPPAGREPGAVPDRRLPRQGGGRHPPPRAQRQAAVPERGVPRAARGERRGAPGRARALGAAPPRDVRERAGAAPALLRRGRRLRQARRAGSGLRPPHAGRSRRASTSATAAGSSPCWPSTRRWPPSSTPCATRGA